MGSAETIPVVWINEQAFAHYSEWECFAAGLYETSSCDDQSIGRSKELLSNSELFLKACMDVISAWRVSVAVNITNDRQNHQSYFGRSACCFNHGANLRETTEAWKLMKPSEQREANLVADEARAKAILSLRDADYLPRNAQSGFLF